MGLHFLTNAIDPYGDNGQNISLTEWNKIQKNKHMLLSKNPELGDEMQVLEEFFAKEPNGIFHFSTKQLESLKRNILEGELGRKITEIENQNMDFLVNKGFEIIEIKYYLQQGKLNTNIEIEKENMQFLQKIGSLDGKTLEYVFLGKLKRILTHIEKRNIELLLAKRLNRFQLLNALFNEKLNRNITKKEQENLDTLMGDMGKKGILTNALLEGKLDRDITKSEKDTIHSLEKGKFEKRHILEQLFDGNLNKTLEITNQENENIAFLQSVRFNNGYILEILLDGKLKKEITPQEQENMTFLKDIHFDEDLILDLYNWGELKKITQQEKENMQLLWELGAVSWILVSYLLAGKLKRKISQQERDNVNLLLKDFSSRKIFQSLIDGKLNKTLSETDAEKRKILAQLTHARKPFEEILSDPSLKNIMSVKQEWIVQQFQLLGKTVPKKLNLLDWQAKVTRNLYFQHKEINELHVKQEVVRILQKEKEYENIPLFQGRNIIFAAHSERFRFNENGDKNRFGKMDLHQRILQDGGKMPLGILRPKNTQESLEQTKKKILDEIETVHPPLTFVFDGHGGSDALYLSDGEMSESGIINDTYSFKITLQDLFTAYKKRQEHFGDKANTPETRDIFINGGCLSATFIRNFYDLCDKYNINKPIFTGEAEVGQYSYGDLESVYGNNFFQSMFGENDGTATLGNLIHIDVNNYEGGNPSLYIPDDNNTTMQLSQKENSKKIHTV